MDLFLLQTFLNQKEMLIAVESIRSVCELTVIASMTFQENPKGFATIIGEAVEHSMKSLKDANALVVGANCSIGSDRMVVPAKEVRKTVSTPVMAAPLKKISNGSRWIGSAVSLCSFFRRLKEHCR